MAAIDGARRAWYLVFVLDVQYFLQGINTVMIGLLVKPVEAAARVTDVGFAAITATPLAIGMALAYYPAGLLGDRLSRRTLVAIGSLLWTLAALIMSQARSGETIFIARLMAGAGMSFTIPPAFSQVTDAFPPDRRAVVFGVFDSLGAIGSGAGLAVAGTIVGLTLRIGATSFLGIHALPWQTCFLIVAGLGAIGTLLIMTTHEPVRRGVSSGHVTTLKGTVQGFMRYLRRHRTLWVLYPTGIMLFLVGYFGVLAWGPAYGLRRFGIESPASIALLGLFTGGGSLLGTIVAGLLAQRLIDTGRARRLTYFCAAGCLAGAAAACLLPVLPSWTLASIAISVIMGAVGFNGVLTSVGVQESAPNEVRGQIIAIFGLLQFFPQSLAATIIAFVAQHDYTGTNGLAVGIAIAGGTANVLGALAFALCARPFYNGMRELLRVAAPDPSEATS